ncbi:MAG: hypothetical protein D5R96_07035 [Methanocalculus sp. MSAO_Arc2]|nr:MAG: hypothetical protein D5R96_07035 [Methanocalculus sp. MSAO_Arc2]
MKNAGIMLLPELRSTGLELTIIFFSIQLELTCGTLNWIQIRPTYAISEHIIRGKRCFLMISLKSTRYLMFRLQHLRIITGSSKATREYGGTKLSGNIEFMMKRCGIYRAR